MVEVSGAQAADAQSVLVPDMFPGLPPGAAQEIAQNAVTSVGARLVVLLRYDATRRDTQLDAWASAVPELVQRAIGAMRRVFPAFEPVGRRFPVDDTWSPQLLALIEGGAAAEIPFTDTIRSVPDPRLTHVAASILGIRYGYYVPLRVQASLTGLLIFLGTRPMSEQQRRTCDSFGRQAALTFENAYLTHLESRRAQQAEHLAATLAEVGGAEDLTTALAALGRGAARLLGAAGCVVCAYEVGVDRRDMCYWVAADEAPGGGTLASAAPAMAAAVVASLTPVRCTASICCDSAQIIEDLAARTIGDSSTECGALDDALSRGQRAALVVPIRDRGKRIGTLHVLHPAAGAFVAADLAVAEALSAQAGATIGRARLEETLREQARRFRALIESGRDVIAVVARDSSVLYASPSSRQVLDFLPEQLEGRSAFNRIHPDDQEYIRTLFADLLAAPRRRRTGEFRMRHADGTWRWMEGTGTNLVDDPAVGGIVVNYHDITARKLAEDEAARLAAEVRDERQRLHDLVSSLPGVVWEAWGEPDAATQRIDFVSDYVEQMLGYTVKEWLSSPNFWLTLVHPDDKERAAREAAAIFASGTSGTSEFRWMAKSGETRHVLAHSVVICDDAGTPLGMRGVTLDVTSRSELERAQKERARMDGALLVSRTVAHDINNALGPIIGFADLLSNRPEVAREPTLANYVRLIAEAADQVASKVKRLQRIIRLEEAVSPLGPELRVLDLERSIEK